jgi:hypothetical protein
MLDLVERVEVLANMLRGAVESVWGGAAKEKGGARSLGLWVVVPDLEEEVDHLFDARFWVLRVIEHVTEHTLAVFHVEGDAPEEVDQVSLELKVCHKKARWEE